MTSANVTDLERVCVGADEKFILGQMRAGASIETASTAWMGELVSQNAALKAEVAELKEDLASRSKGSGGKFSALPETFKTTTAATGSAAEQFKAEVNSLVEGGMDRQKANSKVCRDFPELREAYVAEANANRH